MLNKLAQPVPQIAQVCGEILDDAVDFRRTLFHQTLGLLKQRSVSWNLRSVSWNIRQTSWNVGAGSGTCRMVMFALGWSNASSFEAAPARLTTINLPERMGSD